MPTSTRPHGRFWLSRPVDDGRHQRRLRRGDGLRPDAEDLMQVERRDADDEGGDEDADDQPDLLIDRASRRRCSRSSGPGCRASVGRGDADDGADAERDRRVVSPVQPRATKSRQVRISVAIVMPEIGFDEEPIRPVMRDDTVDEEESEDDARASRRARCPVSAVRARRQEQARAARVPPSTTLMGMSRSVRNRAAAPAAARRSRFMPSARRADDGRNRPASVIRPDASTAPAPM